MVLHLVVILHKVCVKITLGVPPSHFSPQTFVPEVKTWYSVEADVFVSPRRAFQAAIDSLALLMPHATQGAQSFRYVMVEQIYTYVLLIPQVGRGQVSHAGGLLVVVRHDIVHVHIRVSKLFKCPVIYSKHKSRVIFGTSSRFFFKYYRYI